MTRRLISLFIVLLVGAVLFYISRFWPFSLWGREGLFGFEALRPQGGLLARWLRGTPLSPYELVIWGGLCFAALSVLDRIFSIFRERSGS